MPGEDISSRVAVDKSVGTTVGVWLRPSVIDTIKLSASASCESGAADAFERELLVKVSRLWGICIQVLNCLPLNLCKKAVKYYHKTHTESKFIIILF